MFFFNWKTMSVERTPRRVSEAKVREALAPYDLADSLNERLVAAVKNEVELSRTILEATRVRRDELQNIVCEDMGAWYQRTRMPTQLLVAAQWSVGKTCLHPCFRDHRVLIEKPYVDPSALWFSICSWHHPLNLIVSAGSSGFELKDWGRPIYLDLQAPSFSNELEFWLAFVNAICSRGLTDSASGLERITCCGELSAWLNLAKYIENLRIERGEWGRVGAIV